MSFAALIEMLLKTPFILVSLLNLSCSLPESKAAFHSAEKLTSCRGMNEACGRTEFASGKGYF